MLRDLSPRGTSPSLFILLTPYPTAGLVLVPLTPAVRLRLYNAHEGHLRRSQCLLGLSAGKNKKQSSAADILCQEQGIPWRLQETHPLGVRSLFLDSFRLMQIAHLSFIDKSPDFCSMDVAASMALGSQKPFASWKLGQDAC